MARSEVSPKCPWAVRRATGPASGRSRELAGYLATLKGATLSVIRHPVGGDWRANLHLILAPFSWRIPVRTRLVDS